MLKAPRSILEKQRRIVIVSDKVRPGPCVYGAYHEHKCPLCDNMTGGLKDSFCPAVHKEKAIQDYWDKELKETHPFYGPKFIEARDFDPVQALNRMNQRLER